MPRTQGSSNVQAVSANPASGSAGDLVFNTTDKKLYASDGSTWGPVASPPTLDYYYGNLIGKAITPGTWTQITNDVTYRARGWAQHPNKTVLMCATSGLYYVGLHICCQNTDGTFVLPYTQAVLYQRQSDYSTVVNSYECVTGGSYASPDYMVAASHAIFNFTAGQMLEIQYAGSKNTSVDGRSYIWVEPVGGRRGNKGLTGTAGAALPAGGVVNQVLVKRSATDFDAVWGYGDSTGWTAVAFASGWGNAAGMQPARWRQLFGKIELTGQVAYTGGVPTANTAICSGWPSMTANHVGRGVAQGFSARIDLQGASCVYGGSYGGGTVPSNPWVSLDSISAAVTV